MNRVVLYNRGALSGIGGIRPIGDPNDPRRNLGPVPVPTGPVLGLPADPGPSYVIGASRPLGDPYTTPAVYPRADVLLGRGDPEAAALPFAWQSGPQVPSGTVVPRAEDEFLDSRMRGLLGLRVRAQQLGVPEPTAFSAPEISRPAGVILGPPTATRRAPADLPGVLVRSRGENAATSRGLINPALQRPRGNARVVNFARFEDERANPSLSVSTAEGQWPGAASTPYENLDVGGVYTADQPLTAAPVYVPGENRASGRRPVTLSALIAGDTNQITLVDPRIAPPAAPRQWSYPQSALGPRPAGVITAEDIVGFPGDGPNTPLIYGEIGPEYSRGMNIDDRWRDGIEVADLSAPDESGEFTSEDPTLTRLRRSSSEMRPFGMVNMPAVRATGRLTSKGTPELVWRSASGAPLVASVNPQQVVAIRDADPDATYASNRVEEVTLGRAVREAMDENQTPLIAESRLNALLAQRDANNRPMARLYDKPIGNAVGEIDVYTLEDQPIYRLPGGGIEAVPPGLTPPEGGVLIGVQKGVPTRRTEVIYKSQKQGVPLTTQRLVPDGFNNTRLGDEEQLYRVGNAQARDWNQIREEVAPYVDQSATRAMTRPASEWDLAQAEAAGKIERLLGRKVINEEGQVEFAPYSDKALAGLALISQLEPGTPLYREALQAAVNSDPVQGYIRRIAPGTAVDGTISPAVPRVRRAAQGAPTGELSSWDALYPPTAMEQIPNQYVVTSPAAPVTPVGPAPFLVAPAGATDQQQAILGGLRRKAETGENGMWLTGPDGRPVLDERGKRIPLGDPLVNTLNDLAAGDFMLDPTQRSGMEDIIRVLDKVRINAEAQGLAPAAVNQAVAKAAQDISRLSAPGQKSGEGNKGPIAQTSLKRIEQALRERGDRGQRVDLFAEPPITEQELVRSEAEQLYQDAMSQALAQQGLRDDFADAMTQRFTAEQGFREDEANIGDIINQQGAYGDFDYSENRGFRKVYADDSEAVDAAYRDAVDRVVPQSKPYLANYLAEVARRSASAVDAPRPQWDPSRGRMVSPAAPTGERLVSPDAVVEQIFNRPVTVVQPPRALADGGRQLAINLGGAGYRPYVQPSVDAGPRLLDEYLPGESYGPWSLNQLRLPLGGAPAQAAPAAPRGMSSLPEAVRRGLAIPDPSHPARKGAEEYLRRMGLA